MTDTGLKGGKRLFAGVPSLKSWLGWIVDIDYIRHECMQNTEENNQTNRIQNHKRCRRSDSCNRAPLATPSSGAREIHWTQPAFIHGEDSCLSSTLV